MDGAEDGAACVCGELLEKKKLLDFVGVAYFFSTTGRFSSLRCGLVCDDDAERKSRWLLAAVDGGGAEVSVVALPCSAPGVSDRVVDVVVANE